MPSEWKHLDSEHRPCGREELLRLRPRMTRSCVAVGGPAPDLSSPDGGARPSHLVPPRLIALPPASRDARSRMGPSSARDLKRLAMPPCASESAWGRW